VVKPGLLSLEPVPLVCNKYLSFCPCFSGWQGNRGEKGIREAGQVTKVNTDSEVILIVGCDESGVSPLWSSSQ
jgi:hypothetical protein